MARLVGTTASVASMLVLDGSINKSGLLAPLSADINEALMLGLKEYGIQCVEKTIL